MTKTFAVIGDPIDHSLSPNIHSAAFRELDMDCSYIAYRIPRGELDDGIDGLKKIGIDGFNVTIPHKVEMVKYLNKTDESCSLIGAANTVVSRDGMLKGYNTDMDGFLDPFRKRELNIRDSRVLLLGAGGAARAIVAGLAKEKVGNVVVANRTAENADNLSEFAKRIGLDSRSTRIGDVKGSIKEYDIVINATSMGLGGELCPIPMEGIGKDAIVYDIVYMPMNTDFIKRAKDAGATIIMGYEMLLGQATKAFEIWHGVKAPYNAMKKALLGGF